MQSTITTLLPFAKVKLNPTTSLELPRIVDLELESSELCQSGATMADSSITQVRILVINPNTSEHMTDALKPLVQKLGYNHVSSVHGLGYRSKYVGPGLKPFSRPGRIHLLYLPHAGHSLNQFAR
jgi:hypothetical protein